MHSFVYILLLAAFILWQQRWAVVTETVQPLKPIYQRLADLCSSPLLVGAVMSHPDLPLAMKILVPQLLKVLLEDGPHLYPMTGKHRGWIAQPLCLSPGQLWKATSPRVLHWGDGDLWETALHFRWFPQYISAPAGLSLHELLASLSILVRISRVSRCNKKPTPSFRG